MDFSHGPVNNVIQYFTVCTVRGQGNKRSIFIFITAHSANKDTKECLETDVCNMGLSTFTLGEYAVFMPTPKKIFLPVRSRKVNYNCVLFFTKQNIPPEPDGIITVPVVEATGL
jgi:hypothetical protein